MRSAAWIAVIGIAACGDGGAGPNDAPAADAALPDAAPPDGSAPAGRVITVVRAGDGVGTVTSEPDGILCDTDCAARFGGDVVLVAQPGYRSTFTGWSVAACGGEPRCAIPAGADPGSVTATFSSTATGSLRIDFSGDPVVGDVQLIERDGWYGPVAVCHASCTVPVDPGTAYILAAITPSVFTGWSGVCAGAERSCELTAPASGAVTAVFAGNPGERWARRVAGAAVLSADFDPDGNLVVDSTRGVRKYGPDGALLWAEADLPGVAQVDAQGNVVVASGRNLTKLDRDGRMIWSHEAWPSATSTWRWGDMGHWLDVAPSGDIAYLPGGLHVWTGDGVERWSATTEFPAVRNVLGVDPTGVVHVAVDDGGAEPTSLERFAPDGTPLGLSGRVCSQYQFAMAFGPDALWTSCSGYSHVDVNRRPTTGAPWGVSRDIADGDNVRNGVAADGVGHGIWVYGYNEQTWELEGFVAARFDASRVIDWEVTRPGFFIDPLRGPAGSWVEDVAGSADGAFCLVGGYGSNYDAAGWVQVVQP